MPTIEITSSRSRIASYRYSRRETMSSANAICRAKIALNSTQQNQRRKYTPTTRKLGANSIPGCTGRREILLFSCTSILGAAIAAETITDQTRDSRTALLQKYLKKSQENRAKNDKERLDSYYKRNYKDYFGLLEGSLRAKDDQQLSESEKGILDWLEKNK